jgi:predicted RNase H-like HicB family nuclease
LLSPIRRWGAEGGGLKRDDPDSLRTLTKRLFDANNPLSMEELDKNTDPKQGGALRITARTYFNFAKNIATMNQKQENYEISTIKYKTTQWKKQFDNDDENKEYNAAYQEIAGLHQQGLLGKNRTEVEKNIDEIFKTHVKAFHERRLIGPPKKAGWLGGGGEGKSGAGGAAGFTDWFDTGKEGTKAPPAPAPAPEAPATEPAERTPKGRKPDFSILKPPQAPGEIETPPEEQPFVGDIVPPGGEGATGTIEEGQD